MKFQDRIKHSGQSSETQNGQTVEEIARMAFGDLAECFVVVGYAKGSCEKFACKIADNQICDEALEALRPAISNWFNFGIPPFEEEL